MLCELPFNASLSVNKDGVLVVGLVRLGNSSFLFGKERERGGMWDVEVQVRELKEAMVGALSYGREMLL